MRRLALTPLLAFGALAASCVPDTAVGPFWEEDVELEAPSEPITHVRWSIVYERVVAVRGAHVTLASSDVVAEGELDGPLAR